jgi:hypothetical protein
MGTAKFHHLFVAGGAALLLAAAAPPAQETEDPEAARAIAAGAAAPSSTGLPMAHYMSFEVTEEGLGEANTVVSQVMSYTEAHYADLVSVRVFRSGRDQVWTYHIYFEHENLLAYRRTWQRQATDEGWQALWEALTRTYALDYGRLMLPLGGADLAAAPRRLYRKTRSSFANLPRAYQLAREVATHMGETYGVRVTVYVDQYDEPGVIHWFEEYDLFIHMKAVRAKLLDDERYVELFDRAPGLFLDEGYSEELLYELL